MTERWKRPTLQDVLAARQVVSRHLPKTPLHRSLALGGLLGAEVYVKYENHHPVGAFKVRGGIHRLHHLTPQERRAGVVTASTGNHAQSIAYAARAFEVRAQIMMPERANPDKAAAVRDLGGEVLFHGRDFDEARVYAEDYARDRGAVFINSANEPHLISGVGTMALEIFEDLPDPDFLIVPVGGGSSACGNAIVAKAIDPKVRVVGVQAEGAPCVYLSYKAGRIVETPEAATFAEGLATRVPFEMTFGIVLDLMDDIVLVSDDEIERAVVLMLRTTHNLAEGAGASPLAAALKMKDQIAGKKVVLILSGGNLTVEKLREILSKHEA
jgi:threonine dehydratase